MPERIRPICRDDIPKLSQLYQGRKSVEELDWLFEVPGNGDRYNGFVVEDSSDHIIGTIGFAVSEYKQNNQIVRGTIPFSWKIKKDYKGFAGVQLMNHIFAEGDFAIAISGSRTAYKLYRLFHLEHHSNVNTYFCLLDPIEFFLSLKKSRAKSLALTAVLLPSYFARCRRTSEDSITLEPYNGNNFVADSSTSPVFRKIVNKEQLDWMLRCPCVHAYAYNVFHKQDPLGFCVFYTTKDQRYRRGRIVHFPCLDNDPVLWKMTMQHAIRFFKSKACCSFTMLAHDGPAGKNLRSSGFSSIKRHRRPVYIRDNRAALQGFDLRLWNIQYNEGDKAYREI